MSVLESHGRDHPNEEGQTGFEVSKDRQSREELRKLLLATARDILDDEGIQTVSSNLTFKRVFERVERTTGRTVTNASVIRRIWDNMAEFQADVLVDISRDERRPELDRTLELLTGVLVGCDLTDLASRRQVLRELCRTGGEASTLATSDSNLWSMWVNVLAVATTAPDSEQRERMASGLLDGFDSLATMWEGNFTGLFGYLGFRVREPMTMRQFTEAALAWSEGQAIRQRVSGAVSRLSLPTGPDGEMQEWTLFGVGIEALVQQFFEPDPSFVPSA
jgi:hypothetical protein